MKAFFEEYGFVVIANVFTSEQCEETISDIWNVIESFYDGEVDADHSSSKQINVSVDVQRYYKPLLDDKFEGSIRGVKDRFISESKKIFDKPYLLGLLNGD